MSEQGPQEWDQQHERGAVHHGGHERGHEIGDEEECVGTEQQEEPAATAHSARPPFRHGGSARAAGREQGDGQDHFFRRDAAVQEGSAIAGLILTQLGGIDEEPVRGGEQQPDPEAHARETEPLQVLDQNRGLRVLTLQILAELVAQVRRGVALGVHRRRGLAVNGAVVGGEQHRHAPPLGLLERGEHRRALEPGAGEAAQRRLVPRHLVQDGALRPPVRELIHEIEHQRRNAVLGEVGGKPPDQDGVTALVFNFVDQLTHGRSESAILYEVARDEAALRSLTRTWFERSPVLAALQEAERRGVTVLLTTDHGSIHCETPATVYAKRDATANLRYKFGEDLKSEDPEAAILVEDLKGFGLPGRGLGVRPLLATADRFFAYPTKLREYQARYRGSFLHR